MDSRLKSAGPSLGHYLRRARRKESERHSKCLTKWCETRNPQDVCRRGHIWAASVGMSRVLRPSEASNRRRRTQSVVLGTNGRFVCCPSLIGGSLASIHCLDAAVLSLAPARTRRWEKGAAAIEQVCTVSLIGDFGILRGTFCLKAQKCSCDML